MASAELRSPVPAGESALSHGELGWDLQCLLINLIREESAFFCCLPVRKQKQKTDELLFIDLKLVRRCRQHKESKMTQFNAAF